MDDLDKKILNYLQKDFPITSRPYLKIASKLNLDEDEVIARVKRLKEDNYIRRIGGVFDSKNLGFETTLVALRVNPGKVEKVASYINKYKGVTHNYEREDYFNLWFTIVAGNQMEIEEVLSEVKKIDGVEKLLNLPALKLYKIGMKLNL